MLLALLSDTHDNDTALRSALVLLKQHKPELYIHSGDMVSPSMLEHFRGLPFKFILGNNDDPDELARKARTLDFEPPQEMLELTIAGASFCIYHGTSNAALARYVYSGKYRYVVHGHSHLVRDEIVGATRVLNPGALSRARTYTVALLDTATDEFTVVPVPKPG